MLLNAGLDHVLKSLPDSHVKAEVMGPEKAVPLIDYAASQLDGYPQAGGEDAAATEYVTQSYAKAFGALAGLPEGSEVQQITGDDMLSCCRAAGLSLTPLVRTAAWMWSPTTLAGLRRSSHHSCWDASLTPRPLGDDIVAGLRRSHR